MTGGHPHVYPMTTFTGLLAAFIALFAWGVGDFFIQRTTRALTVARSLFFLGLVGALTLLPWALPQLSRLWLNPQIGALLLATAVIAVTVAPLNLMAFRRGKIAVVEPIMGLELPLTVSLAMVVGGERLMGWQLVLIVAVFSGIVLAAAAQRPHRGDLRALLEAGSLLALVGAFGSALGNFILGTLSQLDSPLLGVWFSHAVLAVGCGLYLIVRGEARLLIGDLRRHTGLILAQGALDTVAWVGYALATTTLPIAVATTISQSYVAVAVLLGIAFNRERLRPHQWLGVSSAVAGVIALSAISG